MIRFRWLLALLVALTLPASTVWAQQVALSTLAVASPLGQETPEQPQVESTPPAVDIGEERARCCALQRFVQELLAKWALLWDCGEYRQAEQLAAAAVAQCPHHVDAQHALVVSQIVNSAGMPTGARWGCCTGSRWIVPHGAAVACEEICVEVCRAKPAQAKACCPADMCVVNASCKDCCATTKCASVKAACACGDDCCCAKREQERATSPLVLKHQKLAEWQRLLEARRNERQAYAAAVDARLRACIAGKGNVDGLLESARRLLLAQVKEHEAITEYAKTLARLNPARITVAQQHNVLIRQVPPPFMSGLTPAGTFTPELGIPLIACPLPPPCVTGFGAVPPPPAIIMHTGPQSLVTEAGCVLPHVVVYAPSLPPLCPAPPVYAPPTGLPVGDGSNCDHGFIGSIVLHGRNAHPPLCPALHCDMVAAAPQPAWGNHRPLQITADRAGIRVHTELFEGRCDRVTLKEHQGCIVLDGNVQIEVRGRSHPTRITGQRVRINLKEGTVEVDSAGSATIPRVSTAPVSRPTYSAPMPTPVPTSTPMPRPQRNPPATSSSSTSMEDLLNETENIGQLQRAWRSFWMIDQPSHLTPIRVHGGIGP